MISGFLPFVLRLPSHDKNEGFYYRLGSFAVDKNIGVKTISDFLITKTVTVKDECLHSTIAIFRRVWRNVNLQPNFKFQLEIRTKDFITDFAFLQLTRKLASRQFWTS